MTIDKAIEFYKGYKDRSDGTVNYNEFDEQMIEWLEELSRRRVEELFRKTNEKVIRDKAIDDFADKIISLCDDGEFMNRFNEFTATTILEIAEVLKEER